MGRSALEYLGPRVWWRIRDGEMLKVRQGEVTITDSALLELCALGSPSIRVWKIGPTEERRVGADIDMLIRHRQETWRYLIQAKRLNAAGTRYDTLAHKTNGVPQIDLLERAAKQLRAVPLYGFYNYLALDRPADCWNCCEKPPKTDLFGWTVTPLSTVRRALSTNRARTFQKIHSDPASRPIRCLFCDPPAGSPEPSGALWIEELRSGYPDAGFESPDWVESIDEAEGVVDGTPYYEGVDRDLWPRYLLVLGGEG